MKEYLPIGSVVTLKQGTKKVMICGRIQKETKQGQIYDYCACLYPEGMIDSDLSIFLIKRTSAVFIMSACRMRRSLLSVSVWKKN